LLSRNVVGDFGNLVSFFGGNAFGVGGDDVFWAFLEDCDTSEGF
jgi:hypothetical protein